MEQPIYTHLGQVLPQKYHDYVPTAFDEGLSLYEQLRELIRFLNGIAAKVDGLGDLLKEWEELIVLGNLQEIVRQMEADGRLQEMLSKTVFQNRSEIIVSTEEPKTLHDTLFWYQVVGSEEVTDIGGGLVFDVIEEGGTA